MEKLVGSLSTWFFTFLRLLKIDKKEAQLYGTTDCSRLMINEKNNIEIF